MPSRSVHRTVLALVACGALIACGSDTAPVSPDLNGTWTLSMSNLTGPGVTCTASGTTLDLTTSRGTFSGTYSGGEYTCTDGCQSVTIEVGSGQIVDGGIVRDTVAFDFGSTANTFNGQLTDGAMSGTVTITVQPSVGAPVTLSGNWSATRPTG